MKLKLKTAIIDDEKKAIETLAFLLEEFCPNVELVFTGSSLKEAEDILTNTDLDLVFFDVQIRNNFIFESLKKIDDYPFEIVFVSSHDFAINSFEFQPTDYLLKPVDVEKLQNAVNKVVSKKKKELQNFDKINMAIKSLNGLTRNIPIPVLDGYQLTPVNSILYCLADGSYTKIAMEDGNIIIGSQNLKYYMNLLKDFDFVRIHNSSLVNILHVTKISKSDGGYVVMKNGKSLSISRTKKEETLKNLLGYC